MEDLEIIEDEEHIHTFIIDNADYDEFGMSIFDGKYTLYRDGLEIPDYNKLSPEEEKLFTMFKEDFPI